MAKLLPNIKARFTDSNGLPLAGGKVFSYIANTATPLATYTDASATTPNTNPVILNANGEANIWLANAYYKIIVTDANDQTLYSVDNVSMVEDVVAAAETAKLAAQAAQAAAETAQGLAETAATTATTQASTATTQAGIATTQAGTATTQAGIATTKAGEAASSASTASTQAGIATTQAGIATTKAGEAATSATNAATSAANAASAVSTHSALSSGIHGITGSVVGTSDAQVLTNKDIDGGTASNTSRLTIPKNTKTNLDGLTRKEATLVYATDTKKAYVDDGSTLVAVGSGSGSGVNYIVGGDAGSGTISTPYNDGMTPPFDGAGGAGPYPNFNVTTTNPLSGTTSFYFQPWGGTSGIGHAIAFTTDRAAFSKVLEITFDYEITTPASYTDGDLSVYIVAPSGAVITPIAYKVLKASGPQKFKALFQAESTGTSYKLCLHQTTSANTWGGMTIDSISVGPQTVTVVPTGPVGEIIAYGSLTPPAGFLYCDGTEKLRSAYPDLASLLQETYGSYTNGSGGAGTTHFRLPDLRGMFLRGAGTNATATNANGTAVSATLGARQTDQAQGHRHQYTVYNGSISSWGAQAYQNNTSPVATTGGISDPISDGTNGTPRTGAETRPHNIAVAYHIRYQASTIASSEASDGRPVVVSLAESGTGISLNQWVRSILAFGSAVSDPMNLVTQESGTFNPATGAWTTNPKVTIPIAGWYRVAAEIKRKFSADNISFTHTNVIHKNGQEVYANTNNADGANANGTEFHLSRVETIVWCNAGDYIDIRCISNNANGVCTAYLEYLTVSNIPSGSSIAFNGTVPFSGVGQGTATNPPMTFFGDSNTGLYSPAADTVGVATNGVEKIRVASDGQLSAVVPGGSTLYPGYVCRAWVNFDGTGTYSPNPSTSKIRASGNVSSILKNGTGDYTINFTTAMPDTSFAFIAGTKADGTGAPAVWEVARTTSSVTFTSYRLTGAQATLDINSLNCAIFR